MRKTVIKNRKNQNLTVLIEEGAPRNGLAFVMHGLSGFKEQPHIEAFARAFREQGFTVVRFDTTNTLGESDGRYEDATITNYYEDLEDVIAWSESQPWHQSPFALCGHSLGGICTALYAKKNPHKVLGLSPIATVVSGKLSVEAHEEYQTEDFARWRETGWQISESSSKPGVMKRLPWSHMDDRLKYDLLPGAHKLTMPVLFIVGENDTSTPPKHNKMLYDALPPGRKDFHVIKNAPHTFQDEEHLREMRGLLSDWVKRVLLNV